MPDELIWAQAKTRQARSENRSEAQIFVDGPEHGGQLLDEDAQASFVLPPGFFRSLSLDRESDLAADRVEEFEVALRIGAFPLVVLDDQHADLRSRRPQRNPEPGARRRAYQFDLPCIDELAASFRRNQHGLAGPKNIGRATAPHLFRPGLRVVFVDKERKADHRRPHRRAPR